MNVSLRQLRVFLAVAAAGSFTGGARAVGLSQSAASLNIRLLEEELGLRLLDRTTRQARLTTAGEALAVTAGRLLAGLDASLREARELGAGERGVVRLCAVPTACQRILPQVIAECRRRFPGIEPQPQDCAATEVVRRVSLGEAELGLCSTPMPLRGLLAEPLLEDPFVLLLPRLHRLARQRRVAWSMLAGEALVMLDNSSGSRNVVAAALTQAGVQPQVVLELTQPHSVAAMVAAGLGVAAVPALAVPVPLPRAVVTRPLRAPVAARMIVLVRRPDRSLSPAAETFRMLLLPA